MKFSEFKDDYRGNTLAVRTINNYADELGPDSMDYEMFKTSAKLLDQEKLKSLAQHIYNADTSPREYVMKVISKKDPETFKKMYGDQEGYLSLMKPVQDLKDGEDNTDRGMNKYGLAARNKDGKFYSYRHGKLTGTFNNIQDLQKHQHDLIKDESVLDEDAPFHGMELVRMALMKKFITAEEWFHLKEKWKAAAEEVEDRYSDWPEGEGFGSSDHNFAIKDIMSAVGYEFDDQDTSGRFVVTKMPPELEKHGIINARMRDAVKELDDATPEPLTPDERISPKIKSQGMRDFLDVIIDKWEPNVYDQMEDSFAILHKYNSMTGNKFSDEQMDKLTDLMGKGPNYDDVEFEKDLTKAGVDLEKLGQVAKQYKDDPYESEEGDERAIAAMKVARDESGKFGFEYPEDGTYGYKVKPGEKATDVTLHNRETNEVMHIKDLSYLDLEKGNEQDTLAMIWDENKHSSKITKESQPDAGAERADAARGMWASSKEIQSRFKTWQDFLNSEDFDEWLDDDFREDGMTSADVDRVRNQQYTDKEVRQAKGIAFDKRYKGGNYTGASNTIDKLKKGLSSHPDVADALRRANEEINRITKLAGLGEGASMLPYFKQDEKTWSFPDAWQKDEALDTPYMSNMSMREFLDGLGYDSNFEDASPVEAKEFIARTTQWLQKNIDNPSQEVPTTVDKNPGGPTMYTGGKPEGWMNRQVKHHNELARKILTKYPEVTHFGFN